MCSSDLAWPRPQSGHWVLRLRRLPILPEFRMSYALVTQPGRLCRTTAMRVTFAMGRNGCWVRTVERSCEPATRSSCHTNCSLGDLMRWVLPTALVDVRPRFRHTASTWAIHSLQGIKRCSRECFREVRPTRPGCTFWPLCDAHAALTSTTKSSTRAPPRTELQFVGDANVLRVLAVSPRLSGLKWCSLR